MTRFEDNPFVKKLTIDTTERLEPVAPSDFELTHKKTEEKIDVVYAAKALYDKEGYLKLYKDFYTVLPELSKAEIRVVAYIWATKLEFNRDYIMLTREDLVKNCKCNDERYAGRVITDMIKHKIIAGHHITNLYWINPAMFYKGERRFLTFKKKES